MKHALFDLHCDTALEMLVRGQPLGDNTLAVSLKKAEQFDRYIQVMAFWTDAKLDDETGWRRFLETYNNLLSDPAVQNGKAEICTVCPPRCGRPSLLLALEDARILNGRIERVDALYQMGFRIITPLWGGSSCIGGAHNTRIGLTEFGKRAVRRAIKLGMIPDISHASERSAEDIFKLASEHQRPVIASHSNAYDECAVSRNLKEAQIRAILNCGGIIGLNLYQGFLSVGKAANREDVLRHVAYFLDHGAERALCLGCDMDGATLPPDLPDLSALWNLAEDLLKHYPERIVQNLFFENAYQFATRNFSADVKNP